MYTPVRGPEDLMHSWRALWSSTSRAARPPLWKQRQRLCEPGLSSSSLEQRLQWPRQLQQGY